MSLPVATAAVEVVLRVRRRVGRHAVGHARGRSQAEDQPPDQHSHQHGPTSSTPAGRVPATTSRVSQARQGLPPPGGCPSPARPVRRTPSRVGWSGQAGDPGLGSARRARDPPVVRASTLPRMRHTVGTSCELDSLAELDRRLAAGARSLSGWRVRAIDLSERGAALGRCRLAGATFLGCTFAPGVEERVTAEGALVLPDMPAVPVDPSATSSTPPPSCTTRPVRPASSTPGVRLVPAHGGPHRGSRRLAGPHAARPRDRRAPSPVAPGPATGGGDGWPPGRARRRVRTRRPPGSATRWPTRTVRR